jgi:ankyrin repeat protein
MEPFNDIRYSIYLLHNIDEHQVDPVRYPDLLSILVETTPQGEKIHIWEHIFYILIKSGYTPTTYMRPDGKPLLHVAIESDNIVAVERLLDAFPILIDDPPIYSGMNPLHYAIQLRKTNIVDILLRRGYNPEDKTDNFMTPLAIALMNGYTPDILRILIAEQGVNLRSLNNRNDNILHIVFRHTLYWVLNYLNIDPSEYMDETNREGITPFDYAVDNNILDIVRKYATKDRVNRVNPSTGRTAAFYATSKDMLEIILPFVKNINITDRNGIRLITKAISDRLYDVVDMLVDYGAYILLDELQQLPDQERSKYDIDIANEVLRYLYRWEVICDKRNPTHQEIVLLRSAIKMVGGNSNIYNICNYIRSKEFSDILNTYQQQWIVKHNNTNTTEDMNSRPLWHYNDDQILCITRGNVTYCFYIGDLDIRVVNGVYQFQHPYTRETITLTDEQRSQYLRAKSTSSKLNPLGQIFDVVGYIRK